MAYPVAFNGKGDLTRIMNDLCGIAGLAVLSWFDGNLALQPTLPS